MKIRCYICGKTKYIRPCKIKDINKYHCKQCKGKHLSNLYQTGQIKQDHSLIKKIEMLG